MGLASLALQAMCLIAVDGAHPAAHIRLPRASHVVNDMLLMLFHALLVHGIEGVQSELDVADEGITSTLGEVLAHDHAHELELFGVGSLFILSVLVSGGKEVAAVPLCMLERPSHAHEVDEQSETRRRDGSSLDPSGKQRGEGPLPGLCS